MKRHRFSSYLGSVLEWYDFALYGFFAPLLGKLFFPSTEASSEILASFLVFGIGFLARPLGAVFFGHLSDKYGRAAILKCTPIIIMLPTLAISLLPTYDQIGLTASLLLILLRLLQGICIAGEYGNNMVYLSETATQGRLFFYSSFGSSAASLGILLASLSATLCYSLMDASALEMFGWRLPFFASVFLCFCTVLMRRNLPETPAFKSKAPASNPLRHSFSNQKKDYILAFLVTYLPASAFYFCFLAGDLFGDSLHKSFEVHGN